MASKMTYDKVRSQITTARNRFVREWRGRTDSSLIKMAQDPNVLSVICREQWHWYKFYGREAGTIEDGYQWFLSMRSSTDPVHLRVLEEELAIHPTRTSAKLLADAKAVARKYGGRRLTYHVVCPISKKRYDFESKDDLRWFTVKILGHLKGTKTQRIRLYDGRTYIGSMWRSAGIIYYQSKGVRAKRIVNDRDGTIRR